MMDIEDDEVNRELPESVDDRPPVKNLFKNLKTEFPVLEKLLKDCSGPWGYEDPIYRFYHQSYKV